MSDNVSKKDIFNMLFQQRLRALRKGKNMTQADLANKLNIARTSISSYENGDRYPDPSNMKKLCEFFEVEEDYLSGYSEYKQPPSLKKYLDITKIDPIVLSELTGLNLSTITGIQNGDITPDPGDNHTYLDNLYNGILDLIVNTDQDLLSLLVNLLSTKNKLVIKLLKQYIASLIEVADKYETGLSSEESE